MLDIMHVVEESRSFSVVWDRSRAFKIDPQVPLQLTIGVVVVVGVNVDIGTMRARRDQYWR
ncbi:hypothetical protein TorRG33x02_227160 [Trema orientale]|uniref:Uncharacterized protein n=1 Tax=Trema orientale TaxID=63057 RepID=A0A2P5E7K5_TREOI|nr:hypothetical protein TorRG33x02_227160 [Trema orientale]